MCGRGGGRREKRLCWRRSSVRAAVGDIPENWTCPRSDRTWPLCTDVWPVFRTKDGRALEGAIHASSTSHLCRFRSSTPQSLIHTPCVDLSSSSLFFSSLGNRLALPLRPSQRPIPQMQMPIEAGVCFRHARGPYADAGTVCEHPGRPTWKLPGRLWPSVPVWACGQDGD
jgi:hypothetical protein